MNTKSPASPDSAVPAGDDSAAPSARKSFLKWFLIALKFAVSAALLWFLFATNDLDAATSRLADMPLMVLVLAILIEIVSIALATVRWVVILDAISIPVRFRAAFPIVYMGLFFNQVLPSNLGGDVVRVWRIFRHGSSLGRAVGSVMLDRMMALSGLALLVLASLPFVFGMTGDWLVLLALVALVVAIVGGVGVLLVFDRVTAPFARILPDRLIASLAVLAQDTRRLVLVPRSCIIAVGLSAINFVVMVFMVYVLAMGLGITIGFGDLLVLVPPVILLSMLPISLAGWGVREGAMIVALGFVGVAQGNALALSLLFGVVNLLTALPGGVIWFVTGNRKDDRNPPAGV